MLDLAGSSWIGVFAVLSSPKRNTYTCGASGWIYWFNFPILRRCFSVIIDDAIDGLRKKRLCATENC